MKLSARIVIPLFLALAILPLCGETTNAPDAAPIRVLFLGNSFTYCNKLPELIQQMAAAGKPSRKLVTTTITYGGRTMEYHWGLHSQNWVKLPGLTEAELEKSIADLKQQFAKDTNNGNIRRAIQRHEALRPSLKEPRPKYDFVVLQSWKDTEGGTNSAYVEYARRFAALAREQGSKVVFYDTAPDSLNAQPLTNAPARAPAEERARVLATIAREFDALVVPVPLVVWHCQTQRPELPLRYVKDFHLNQTMGYLTAATFYAVLFGESPEGIPVNEVTDVNVLDPAHPELGPDGDPQRKVLDDDLRLFLQRTAARAVADFRQLSPVTNTAPLKGVSTGDHSPNWMRDGKYGVFMHYQYRILLGYSVATVPKFPRPDQMTAEEWNRLVDGFDAKGFADQMAEGGVGWVIFCLDDHHFAWPCAPNAAFSKFTGYAPGEKCSRRDLFGDVADALQARGVKLIAYYAGLNGYMKEPKVSEGLADDGKPGTAPTAEGRRRRLAVLKEYADRYGEKISGWWFDGMALDSYRELPDDWWALESVVRSANPHAVIAFSYGRNEQACLVKGVDDFTGGDTWKKQDLKQLTPALLPAQEGILWHGKIYCGDVYHGQGTTNQFGDDELINWIKTCNQQGGVCTLDWPIDPPTGKLKDFGFAQLKRIRQAIKPGH